MGWSETAVAAPARRCCGSVEDNAAAWQAGGGIEFCWTHTWADKDVGGAPTSVGYIDREMMEPSCEEACCGGWLEKSKRARMDV